MKKLIVLSFLVAACAVSLANTEVSALDNTVINQYLLLKNDAQFKKIVALSNLIQRIYHNDIRNMLP